MFIPLSSSRHENIRHRHHRGPSGGTLRRCLRIYTEAKGTALSAQRLADAGGNAPGSAHNTLRCTRGGVQPGLQGPSASPQRALHSLHSDVHSMGDGASHGLTRLGFWACIAAGHSMQPVSVRPWRAASTGVCATAGGWTLQGPRVAGGAPRQMACLPHGLCCCCCCCYY